MKHIRIIILWLLFLWGIFYTHAAGILELDDAIFWWYFSGSQNNQTQLHFNYGGQDFAWTVLWKDVVDVTATITFSGWEVKTCSKKLRWLYYNNKRGERVWPLDEYSLDALQDLDSSYDALSITGWLYTMCDGTGLEIYGNVTHTRKNSSYTLLAWVGYDFLTNTYTTSFSWSMYFQWGNSYGYLFDTYGGIADVSWTWLTIPIPEVVVPVAWSNWWWGGGAWVLTTDVCTDNRDCSDSYYDNICGPCEEDEEENHWSAEPIWNISGSTFSSDINTAYQRAYSLGITTMPTIQEANITGGLTRVAMAKMMSNFAINVLWLQANTGMQANFPDVSDKLDTQYDNGVTKAFQLGLMGVNIKEFNPYWIVTRAEFGTVLSRALYGDTYNQTETLYYTRHLQALKRVGIMTQIENPAMKEIRGYVMLMMLRWEGATELDK